MFARSLCALVAIALLTSGALIAEDSLERALARAAEQTPDPARTFAAARQRLATRLDELEQFLARGDAQSVARWADRLELPVLRSALQGDQPDLDAVRRVERRFYRNDPGLEGPRFMAVRDALGGYLAALEYQAASSPAELYRQRLEQLEQLLVRLDSEPNDADAQEAGAATVWLARLSPEGRHLGEAVRARYGRPNAQAQISARLIDELLSQEVSQSQYITDVILGNMTHGPAYTSAKVSFGIIPHPSSGLLEIRLHGLTSCPANIAQRGNIVVHSSATTSLNASKQVQMSGEGLTLHRAAAWCQTSAQINDIRARWQFVERLARRKAEQMLPDAEQHASRRAEREASAGLDQQGDAALGGINDFFRDQLRKPLIRLDALPDPWRFWTDRDHLRMTMVQASGTQLGTAREPPEFPASWDLALGGHESMINNFCESALGGRQVRDEAFLTLMNTMTGSQPRALWVHDRAERWSVTFAARRPVVAQFQDDRIRLTLRLDGLTRGAEHFAHPLEITAQFEPTSTREGPALLRDGDVAVTFGESLAPADEARQRQFLLRKFNAVLPPELHFYGLVPPAGGQIGRLRALTLEQFAAQDGWFTLAYEMKAAAGE
jgi:hypothetical protein